MFQPSAGLNLEHHTYGDSMQAIGYSCQVLELKIALLSGQYSEFCETVA
jgi:hypothetical protein